MDPLIFHADSRLVADYLEPDSIDSVVTDPPYGLRLLGKSWDYIVPPAEHWAQVLKVAKPGAHLLAFGGRRTWHRLAVAIEDAGWEIGDSLAWFYGQGAPKSSYALKPAHEPIVFARKPGPHRELNIDACRIPAARRKGGHTKPTDRNHERVSGDGLSMRAGDPCDGKGRWPPTVLLDEEAAAMLDEQTGILTSGSVTKTYEPTMQYSVAISPKRRRLDPTKVFSDSGGASRFMYVAKASKSERTHNGAVENDHPTVKPLALMSWLIRLVTPSGGCVLDPFCGSGSTLVAATEEGFDCIGFDKDIVSVNIAMDRAKKSSPHP